MKNIYSITGQCRGLLEQSNIPDIYKSVIRSKYDDIEQLLQGDEVAKPRGQFLGLDRFQKMLQHAQLLQERPAQANAFSNLLQSSNAVIQFLHGTYY